MRWELRGTTLQIALIAAVCLAIIVAAAIFSLASGKWLSPLALVLGVLVLGPAYAWIVWMTHYVSLEADGLEVRHGPRHTVLDTAIRIDYEAIERVELMPDGKEVRIVYRDPPETVYESFHTFEPERRDALVAELERRIRSAKARRAQGVNPGEA
jgi:hypothetical protein